MQLPKALVVMGALMTSNRLSRARDLRLAKAVSVTPVLLRYTFSNVVMVASRWRFVCHASLVIEFQHSERF